MSIQVDPTTIPLSSSSSLILLSISLFIGCLIFGYIPLYLNISNIKLLYLSTLSVGILVGTSLVLIIPEGVDMIYSSKNNNDNTGISNTKIVGISILCGFIFMLLMDRISVYLASSDNNNNIEYSELNNLSISNSNSNLPSTPSVLLTSNEKLICGLSTTTIGLLIHNFVDGLALGSSAISGSSNLTIVVFLAILLHKAPASLAFTTINLQSGKSKSTTLKLLTLFCAAVPFSTLLTYYTLSFISGSPSSSDNHNHDSNEHNHDSEHDHSNPNSKMIGVFLLFSAGTFLYVSLMHILPEVEASIISSKPKELEHIHDENEHSHNHSNLPWQHTVLLIIGMFLPIVLSGDHHH